MGQCCLRLLQAGGLPSGVLMIGDGLSSVDGRWIFDRVKSPEPENMLQRLYAVDNGFSCPMEMTQGSSNGWRMGTEG